jgi:hypothetical protein
MAKFLTTDQRESLASRRWPMSKTFVVIMRLLLCRAYEKPRDYKAFRKKRNTPILALLTLVKLSHDYGESFRHPSQE